MSTMYGTCRKYLLISQITASVIMIKTKQTVKGQFTYVEVNMYCTTTRSISSSICRFPT